MVNKRPVFAGRSSYMENKPKDSTKELFPLLMSSIEKFHWYDSLPNYPNFIFGRLEFTKRIDPSLAETAWKLALDRQPLAGVQPVKIKRRWYWKPSVDDKVVGNGSAKGSFNYQESASSPDPWCFEECESQLTISSHLEIRVSGAEASPSDTCGAPAGCLTSVYFAVHHAISDGAGAILVVNEWLAIYSNLEAGRAATAGLQRLEPERLRGRNHLGILRWSYLKHLFKQPVALFGATKFLFRNSVDLSAQKDAAEGMARLYPAIVGRWVDADAVRGLNRESCRLGVTLNSIMLGRLFESLTKFLARDGVSCRRDWVRVILPISIRGMSDRRMPATNRTTIVQLDRRLDEKALSDDFYSNLDREIRIIRGWQLDKIFLICIRLLSIVDPVLRHIVGSRKSRGTVVFTNLGEPFRKLIRSQSHRAEFSGSAMHQFDLVGPVREGTPLNYTVARHGERIRVSLHYDAGVFSSNRAGDLLDSYVSELLRDPLCSVD